MSAGRASGECGCAREEGQAQVADVFVVAHVQHLEVLIVRQRVREWRQLRARQAATVEGQTAHEVQLAAARLAHELGDGVQGEAHARVI
jgi:hypothetical protein